MGTPRAARRLGPRNWPELVGAVALVGVLLAAPAAAAPVTPPDRIPDTGSRPVAAAPLGPAAGGIGAGTSAPGALGALAGRLAAAEAAVQRYGQQLTQAAVDRDQAAQEVATLTTTVREARHAREEARRTGQLAAYEAYRSAAGLPSRILGSDLARVTALSGPRGQAPESLAASGQLARTVRTAAAAEAALTGARTRLRDATGRHRALTAGLARAGAALAALRRTHARQLVPVERERARRNEVIGRDRHRDARGLVAHRQARVALAYARRQLGKPYLLNSEGPDTFDCSGLIMMAYRAAGYGLPRVAAQQYAATAGKRADPMALLPGDLLFFNLTTDPAAIHHVALYLGGGLMIHAPQPGQQVSVAPVSWSSFFAATRIFAGVPTAAAGRPRPWKPRPPTAAPTAKPTPSPDGDKPGGGGPGKPGGDKPGGGTGNPGGGNPGSPGGGTNPGGTPTPVGSRTPVPHAGGGGTPAAPGSAGANIRP
ncbi:hypothetical protein GCM10010124_12540 [Pilimelia terevasa]|uniref:NlpC/P60 domain-containing protein n=1 Tax=Pilimelia terevasa TaxID=53372 RepID=A0A8J3FFL8_9ACTN|nr:C40 family peptidase [Pilimelia terevasa]GGK21550.1 hypothetical protein GCM10010124_12540 [Pilimelia terevasa]